MGPSQSQNKHTNQENNETEVLTINHPKFNNLKVISPPTDEDQGIIQITVPLPNENQFKKWDKKVKEVGQSENIFMPISQKFEKTEFCGSGGLASIQFKYYPYLLSDEVINRCNMEGKFFEEAELWYLVYSIIQAGSAYHTQGQKVGDIRPQNVFISPQGQVRVATQFTWPGEQTNYQKTVFQKETTYLSPQQLKDICHGKLDQSANFAINESFSIGLTCLDAAALTDSSKLYEPNNKFNYTKLEERLNTLQQNAVYSEPLTLILKSLCQVQSEKRATCRQLAGWLEKYEESIIELQEFAVKQIPEKLQLLRVQKGIQSRLHQQLPVQYQQQYQPQPQPQYQPQPQPQPQQFLPPQVNNSKNPTIINFTNGSNRPQPIVFKQYVQQQVPIQNTYVQPASKVNTVNTVPMVQSYYTEYVPPQAYSQATNNNSSSITFQKQIRSNVENSGSQLRGNLNLQQIDEQLQMSRKLFPS